MRTLRKESGFSLVEVTVALVIGAILFFAAYSVLTGSSSGSKELSDILEAQEQALQLSDYLLGVGRLAESCERPCSRAPLPSGVSCELQCSIKNATGLLTQITVLSNTTTGKVTIDQSSSPGAWQTVNTFQAAGFRRFEVCGDAEMVVMPVGTPGTCPIRIAPSQPDKLESQYAAGTTEGRFYRFRITVAGTVGKGATAPDRQLVGAFYVRNPFVSIDPRWPVPKVSKEK